MTPTRNLLLLAAALVVSLALAEGLLRWTEPEPEISPANQLLNRHVLREDVDTVIHLRSHVDVSMELFWPDWLVRIRTNATGQRMDAELPAGKPEGSYRIAALGDSSTMGWGVAVGDAYPERLAALVSARHPRVEVLNFGTVGFSSHNGLAQLRSEVLPLAPDLVTVAFGFNDWSEWTGSDAQVHARLRETHARRARHPLLDRTLRRLDSLALARRLEALWLGPAEPLPWSKRVPLDAYAANLAAIVEASRARGADVVLLNLNLANRYGARELRELAERSGAPLLDVRRLFEQELPLPTRDLEERLDLTGRPAEPPLAGPHVVFRAWAPEPTPRPVLILAQYRGDAPRRGEHLALHDDGSHGDQRAGDRVFSLALPAEAGAAIDYSFPIAWGDTWPELFQLYLSSFYHHLDADPSAPASRYAPVQRAGFHPLRPVVIPWDVVHPNEDGHRRIARALAEIVADLSSFQASLAEAGDRSATERWLEQQRRAR